MILHLEYLKPTKIYPRECFKSSNLVGSVKYSSLKNEDNFKNSNSKMINSLQTKIFGFGFRFFYFRSEIEKKLKKYCHSLKLATHEYKL